MKRKMILKKIKNLVCITAALFLLTYEALASTVTFDGTPLEESILVGDTAYVGIRAFAERSSECDVTWNSDRARAIISSDELTVEATEGMPYINANGRILYSGRTVKIIDGTLYAPLRSLAKAYGGSITWDADEGTAHYTSGASVIKSASEFYDEDTLYWLSRIISAESRGEPLLGQIAVGNVVFNRLRSPDFPNTVYSVIFDRKHGVQFTPVANGAIYMEPAEISVNAAKIVLEGYSVSDRILYFIEKSIATNFWVPQNRAHEFKIGAHDFYS